MYTLRRSAVCIKHVSSDGGRSAQLMPVKVGREHERDVVLGHHSRVGQRCEVHFALRRVHCANGRRVPEH